MEVKNRYNLILKIYQFINEDNYKDMFRIDVQKGKELKKLRIKL